MYQYNRLARTRRGKVVAKNSIADASLIKSEPHWHGKLIRGMKECGLW